jgi:hypothetical protein
MSFLDVLGLVDRMTVQQISSATLRRFWQGPISIREFPTP